MFVNLAGGVARSRPQNRVRANRRLLAERLETRLVLSNMITTFSLPAANSQPKYPTVGPDGSIWFVEVNSIGKISYGGDITEFPLPDGPGTAQQITLGPDGNVWFTETTRKIGKISPTGEITQYALPAGSGIPNAITSGPDGNIWFTESNASAIGRITPEGTITEYPEGTAKGTQASAITSGPNGNVWFTETGAPAVAEIAPNGTITRFPITAQLAGPESIVTGSDGNVWFSDPVQGTIGRVTTTGQFNEYHVFPAIDHLVQGPDSALYGEMAGGEVLRMDFAGNITNEQPILDAYGDDSGLALGLDGNLWMTETTSNAILSVPPDLVGAQGPVNLTPQPIDPSAGLTLAPTTIATLTTAETNPNVADYSATIDWGDGTSLSQATLAPLNPPAGSYPPPGLTVSAGHTYARSGTFDILIQATSSTGQTLTAKEVVNVAPEVLVLTPSTISPTSAFSSGSVVVATAQDSLPLGDSTFSAMIHWGDGSPATPGTIVSNAAKGNGSTFQIVGNHTYANLGQYPIQVTVTSLTGASATVTGAADVVNSPAFTASSLSLAAQTAVAIDPQPIAVWTYADSTATASAFTATINWGDGSAASPGTISVASVAASAPGTTPVVPGHLIVNVSGSHTYNTAGTYDATVSIQSSAGSTSSAATTMVVTDPTPPVTTSPPSQDAGGAPANPPASDPSPDPVTTDPPIPSPDPSIPVATSPVTTPPVQTTGPVPIVSSPLIPPTVSKNKHHVVLTKAKHSSKKPVEKKTKPHGHGKLDVAKSTAKFHPQGPVTATGKHAHR